MTPWAVTGKIDYKKLVEKFGSTLITSDMIARIEAITHRPIHPWIRRGIVFSHRDLDIILDVCEKRKGSITPFFIYTGRGPSSDSLHLGHMVPFMLTRYLQEAFDVPLVIQMSDDEKFYFKDELTLEKAMGYTQSNARDIISVGFDPAKTFIFSNTEYMCSSQMYKTVVKIDKKFTGNTNHGIFGLDLTNNVGELGWPSKQMAPAFSDCFSQFFTSYPPSSGQASQYPPSPSRSSVPCLVPMAIDQDPYFRGARDVAPYYGWFKPAVIHSIFLPSLEGAGSKMSSTSTDSPTIFMTDTPDDISRKVKRFAFSGAPSTLKELKEKGANLEIDTAYQYLRFFEMDDAKLESVGKAYSKGEMTSSDVKQLLIDKLVLLVEDFKVKRTAITDAKFAEFFAQTKKW